MLVCELRGCQATVHEDYLQACDDVLSGGYVGKFGDTRCPRSQSRCLITETSICVILQERESTENLKN